MKRLKTFLIYALLVAGLWLFSDIIIYLSINGTYQSIETRVYATVPEISVGQSKATYINGYVSGIVTNNSQEVISNKYIKIDLYSARNIKLGSKYIEINNLQQNASQEFKMNYKFTDVDYAIITVTDDVSNATEEEFLSQETKGYLLIGTLLILYFI